LKKKLGVEAAVSACKFAVQVAVGYAGSNISHGAICSMKVGQRSRTMMLCDDEQFGHFALSVDAAETEAWVIDFVRNNCYGG
jgi:hypothetical protein